MAIYYLADRTNISVDDAPIAKGGEGSVYSIKSPKNYINYCVKILHKDQITKQKESKIKYMVAHPPEKIEHPTFLICWPTQLIYDFNNKFIGFLMPLAFKGSIQLYELTNPTITNKKLSPIWRQKYDRTSLLGLGNRLKLCVNIAIGVHTIHSIKQYVFVDFKPQNILITDDAKISIIDIDSIQISKNYKILHHAKVITAEYSPKESENLNPTTATILETWDRFSIAVTFYQILFGIHPYSASSDGQYSNCTTLSDKIQQNLFVHGSKKNYLSHVPPPHKNFYLLPQSIRVLFLRAFEDGSQDGSKRPTAEEWGKLMYAELIKGDIKVFKDEMPKPNITQQKTVINNTLPQQTISPKIAPPHAVSPPKQTTDTSGRWAFFIAGIVLLFFLFKYLNKEKPENTTEIVSNQPIYDVATVDTTVSTKDFDFVISNILTNDESTTITFKINAYKDNLLFWIGEGIYIKVGNIAYNPKEIKNISSDSNNKTRLDSGQEHIFSLVFPSIGTATKIDIIECSVKDCYNFYEVDVSKYEGNQCTCSSVDDVSSVIENRKKTLGKMLFWSSVSENVKEVYINKIYEGYISKYSVTKPTLFGVDGSLSLELPIGNYEYAVLMNSKSWSGSFTILPDSLQSIELTSEDSYTGNFLNGGFYKFASERLLADDDLSGLSVDDKKLMINEIYARKGYIFKTSKWIDYFNSQEWYLGGYSDVKQVEGLFTEIEKQNIAFIKSSEKLLRNF